MFLSTRVSRRAAFGGAIAIGLSGMIPEGLGVQHHAAAEQAAGATPIALDPLARQNEVMTAASHPDEIGVHGMLLVGEDTIYLSHLPMFTDPAHRFQVILEVTLEQDGQDPRAAYLSDRQASGATLYTVQPDPTVAKRFALRELIADDATQRRAFDVTLFRGHFERGGSEPILAASAHVTRVVRFQQVDQRARPSADLEYLLFGGNGEYFLAHLITGPPDFDQVLNVRDADLGIPDDAVRQGFVLTVPRRANSITSRLRGGEDVTVVMQDGDQSHALPLTLGDEIYFEEGELRVPHTPDDTEEEIAAGMP